MEVDEATAEPVVEASKGRKRKRADSDDEDDESDWEDVYHSSDDENDDDVAFDEAGNKVSKNNTEHLSLEEKALKAADVTASRILTDADFRRIDAAQLKKQVQGFRKGGKKRKLDTVEVDESATAVCRREELVDLANIEMIHKKRRHDKESRYSNIFFRRLRYNQGTPGTISEIGI